MLTVAGFLILAAIAIVIIVVFCAAVWQVMAINNFSTIAFFVGVAFIGLLFISPMKMPTEPFDVGVYYMTWSIMCFMGFILIGLAIFDRYVMKVRPKKKKEPQGLNIVKNTYRYY